MNQQPARQQAQYNPVESRIDVSCEDGQTTIRLLTWSDGLGWQCQKTLSVAPEMLDDLHRSIAAARKRTATANAGSAAGKVIEFPIL